MLSDDVVVPSNVRSSPEETTSQVDGAMIATILQMGIVLDTGGRGARRRGNEKIRILEPISLPFTRGPSSVKERAWMYFYNARQSMLHLWTQRAPLGRAAFSASHSALTFRYSS